MSKTILLQFSPSPRQGAAAGTVAAAATCMRRRDYRPGGDDQNMFWKMFQPLVIRTFMLRVPCQLRIKCMKMVLINTAVSLT